MSAKRFEFNQYNQQGQKIGSAVHPSHMICLKNNDGREEEYYLKSIVEHDGTSIASGHYTSKIFIKNKWIIRNDSDNPKVSENDPLGGYLFLYERTPTTISQDMLDSLVAEIEEVNQQEIDIRNRKTRCEEKNFAKTTKEIPEEGTQEEGSNSVESIEVEHLPRSVVIERLEGIGILIHKNQTTVVLRNSLKMKLKSQNPIHEYLKSLKTDQFRC